MVLRRQLGGRVHLTNFDRLFLVQLYHWFPSIRRVLTVVQPETLVRWHRADLLQIGLALDKLGAAGADVQPLFISLDPDRDTQKTLAEYVAAFHPRLIGLTGTPEQIRTVADEYKVYYAKYTPPDGGEYLIDHSGFSYVMDRDGKYLGFFPPGTAADRIVEIVRPLLATQ